MRSHYICVGDCEGVSDKPGTCQDKECDLYQKQLVECGCVDGLHEGLLEGNED